MVMRPGLCICCIAQGWLSSVAAERGVAGSGRLNRQVWVCPEGAAVPVWTSGHFPPARKTWDTLAFLEVSSSVGSSAHAEMEASLLTLSPRT